jgi:hypothetical protein
MHVGRPLIGSGLTFVSQLDGRGTKARTTNGSRQLQRFCLRRHFYERKSVAGFAVSQQTNESTSASASS